MKIAASLVAALGIAYAPLVARVVRGQVLSLKQQRDEASVLMKEVETAQRAYDQVVARASQTNLESQNTQTNISVLTPATEPADHSSPKLLLNTLLSVFLGTLLAVALKLNAFFRLEGPQEAAEDELVPVKPGGPEPPKPAPARDRTAARHRPGRGRTRRRS